MIIGFRIMKIIDDFIMEIDGVMGVKVWLEQV